MKKPDTNAKAMRPAPAHYHLSTLALLASASALVSSQVMAEAAPTATKISLKTLSYQDYQPDADRIAVDAKAVEFVVPLSEEWSLTGNVVHDAISGASPKYHTSGLTEIIDTRNAYTASVSRYFRRDTVTAGYSYSKEHDYLSRNYSLQNSWSTDNQNTTLVFGGSYSADEILPNSIFLRSIKDKRTLDLVAGLTQVMTQTDLAQITLRHSQGRGYFSDQYKLYDLRPDERRADSLLLRWNHFFSANDSTLHASYRYYQDSFDIKAHTFEFEYVYNLGHNWQLTPVLRYYSQTRSSFYFDPVANDPYADADTAGAPISVVYNRYLDGLPASMDQRLSAFGALTYGIKVEKTFARNWSVDAKFEQYQQKGSWALGGGSPGLADFSARSLLFGVSHSF
ncbi:MAG: DUF3570 domain-containing protein [Gammaproteobacteria bacterium]|jgi:hypothetical protein